MIALPIGFSLCNVIIACKTEFRDVFVWQRERELQTTLHTGEQDTKEQSSSWWACRVLQSSRVFRTKAAVKLHCRAAQASLAGDTAETLCVWSWTSLLKLLLQPLCPRNLNFIYLYVCESICVLRMHGGQRANVGATSLNMRDLVDQAYQQASLLSHLTGLA